MTRTFLTVWLPYLTKFEYVYLGNINQKERLIFELVFINLFWHNAVPEHYRRYNGVLLNTRKTNQRRIFSSSIYDEALTFKKSVLLFIYSFIHSFIHLFIYLSIYLSVCLFIDWLLAFIAFTLYSIFYVIFKIMSIHWVSVTLANIVYPYFLLFSHRRVSLLNSDNFHELTDELIDEMFYALWHNLTIQIMFCF